MLSTNQSILHEGRPTMPQFSVKKNYKKSLIPTITDVSCTWLDVDLPYRKLFSPEKQSLCWLREVGCKNEIMQFSVPLSARKIVGAPAKPWSFYQPLYTIKLEARCFASRGTPYMYLMITLNGIDSIDVKLSNYSRIIIALSQLFLCRHLVNY